MSLLRNVVNQLPDAGGILDSDLLTLSREGRWRKTDLPTLRGAIFPGGIEKFPDAGTLLDTDVLAVSRGGVLRQTDIADIRTAVAPITNVSGLYDATNDVLRARTQPGYVGDQVSLNAAFASRRGVCVSPDVGFLDIRATVQIPQAGSRFACLGGIQATPIFRSQTCTGATIRVGNPNPSGGGAGGCTIDNLWMLHDGRGPGQYTEGSALPNRLTNGESHLEIHGGQGVTLRAIGGWGAVYGISLYGCVAVTIDSPFFLGGVWDPALASAQETIAQINLGSSTGYGYNKNVTIIAPTLIGNISTGRRDVVVQEKTVQVTRRIGPRYGLLVRSCEDYAVFGGFIGGAADDSVTLRPVTASDYIINGRFVGVNIDECNNYLVSAYRGNGAPMPDGLDIVSSRISGQICAINGVRILPAADGGNSLRTLTMPGTVIRDVLGGGAVLLGLGDSNLSPAIITGYNCANSGDQLCAGIAIGGSSSYVDVDQTRFGGGINGIKTASVVDAFGISGNGTKFGLTNLPGPTNITKGRFTQFPFGQTGGALTAGTFAPDPS